MQACQRKFLLASEWKPYRWRPKLLHDACLRQAIIQYSNGKELEQVRADARAQFLQAAANPGLDVKGSPYPVAKEWATLLEVLISYLKFSGVPYLLQESALTNNKWRLTAQVDGNGNLHRYITVADWDQGTMDREIHSWYVAGDMAQADRRLTLHVFEIGKVVKGHRASLWVRGWRHPKIPHLRVRFQHTDGSSFRGWNPVRLTDHPEMDVEAWVGRIHEDGAGMKLAHSLEIEPPSRAQRESILRDILVESARARNLIQEKSSIAWSDLPMSRESCDGMLPCQFRDICYGGITDIAASGLFVQLSPADASCTSSALLGAGTLAPCSFIAK